MIVDGLELRTKSIEDSIVEATKIVEDLLWVNYQPGNGTAYRFQFEVITPGSPPSDWMFSSGAGFLITWFPESSYKSFGFSNNSFLNAEYLRQKIRCGISDARVLAEIFAFLARKRDPDCNVTADDAGA